MNQPESSAFDPDQPAFDGSFESLLADEPDRVALILGDSQASRGELLEASRAFAALLHARGIGRGDVINVWLPDGAAWLQCLFGAAHLGVLVVPISTRYRREEARHVIVTSRPKLLLVPEAFLTYDYAGEARALCEAIASPPELCVVDTQRGFIPADPSLGPAPHTGRPEDPLCTFSTSGTTGLPKLAMHDQRGIAIHALTIAARAEVRAGDRMLCALSLYGVLGFNQAMAALAGAAACVFLPVFKPQDAIDAMVQHRVTHYFGSDGLFAPVLEGAPGRYDHWRFGGFAEFAGLGRTVVDQAEQAHGTRLVAVYGSSECFALMAMRSTQAPAEQRAMPGGSPVSPGIAFRVVDPVTRAPLGDRVQGELEVRGYNVMTGYVNNPQATAAVLDAEGWYATGDLAYSEDGGASFVYLARLKDSLRLHGYLVDPGEIEAFLCTHADIAAAQVVGVNRLGEGDVAVAFVIARAGAAVDLAALTAWCRRGISGYKVPGRIVAVEVFPQTVGPNGTKIQKNRLREMAQAILEGV
ncbi:MAG: AMP-binding protein [Proteobacteria bacterium]|nr:AMP-binding protein [Pseudomonadota bacterium]